MEIHMHVMSEQNPELKCVCFQIAGIVKHQDLSQFLQTIFRWVRSFIRMIPLYNKLIIEWQAKSKNQKILSVIEWYQEETKAKIKY
jgi:hypothetical protein